MTGPSDDRDLADRFARLHREQREAASTFATVAARRAPRRSRRVRFVGLATAVVATIAIGAVVIRQVRPPDARETPPVLDVRSARWVAPTDFLLNVPGNWLLRDLPRIAAPASFRFDTITYRRVLS